MTQRKTDEWDSEELIGPSDPPNVFMQWKGTTVCMDATCTCGANGHICGEMFAYALRCANCGQHWAMPAYLGLTPMSNERAEDYGTIISFGHHSPPSTSEIKPALPPEHWEIVRGGITHIGTDPGTREVFFQAQRIPGKRGSPSVVVDPTTEPHALAALALYGQTFGFSREDVADCRNAYHDYVVFARHAEDVGDQARRFAYRDAAARFYSLADRIEALLPPEEK